MVQTYNHVWAELHCFKMSCCRDEELEQQKRANASIERQLKIEKKTFCEPQRLFIFGTESTQSTESTN